MKCELEPRRTKAICIRRLITTDQQRCVGYILYICSFCTSRPLRDFFGELNNCKGDTWKAESIRTRIGLVYMLGHLHAAFNSIYDKAFQISLLKAALYIYIHTYVCIFGRSIWTSWCRLDVMGVGQVHVFSLIAWNSVTFPWACKMLGFDMKYYHFIKQKSIAFSHSIIIYKSPVYSLFITFSAI